MTASIVAQTTAYRLKYSTRSHAVCGSYDGLVFSAAANKGACFVCPERAPGSCGAAREPVGEACNKSTQSRYLQLRSVLRQHLCGSVSIITIECRTSRGIQAYQRERRRGPRCVGRRLRNVRAIVADSLSICPVCAWCTEPSYCGPYAQCYGLRFLLLWRTIARFGAALRGEGRVGAALAATPTPANDGACFIAFVPSAPASVVWLSLARSSTAVARSAAQWACAIASVTGTALAVIMWLSRAIHVRVAGFTTVRLYSC